MAIRPPSPAGALSHDAGHGQPLTALECAGVRAALRVHVSLGLSLVIPDDG
jgi:hypothetical protein